MGKKCGRFFKKDFHTFCLSFVQLCNSWFQSPTGWWAPWAQARFARHNWAQCGKNAIPVLFYALIWHFIPTFQISPQIFHSPIFLQHFLPYFPKFSPIFLSSQFQINRVTNPARSRSSRENSTQKRRESRIFRSFPRECNNICRANMLSIVNSDLSSIKHGAKLEMEHFVQRWLFLRKFGSNLL